MTKRYGFGNWLGITNIPGAADWDEGARPWLTHILTLRAPAAGQKPQWTEGEFNGLLQTLGHAGYGWLRPEGVRR